MTSIVAKRLIDLDCKLSVKFIVGDGYNGLISLKQILSDSHLNYEIQRNVKNMLKEYLRCDVAIGAGGLTASELIASRTPSLLIATYEHQITRCQYFNLKGWAKYIGFRDASPLIMEDIINFNPLREKTFTSKINQLVEYIDRAIL